MKDLMHIHYLYLVFGIRSKVTRDYYLRRLRIFFNHINLERDKPMEDCE